MLSKEENELLTKTAPGTPMGELLRHYWIPALLSEEILAPDGPPAQVKLLGEELVAFRDSMGRIGLLADHCSHRGASLYYGRNEDCGLRCIYHGWKYDVDGNVVDTPAEPGGSDFKKKVRHTAYPCKEVAGIIFAYLGPRDKMPLFPAYEWTQVPRNKTYVTKCLQECNYLQGLEGECDSSHLSYLHRSFKATGRQALYSQDSAPRYEVEETDFGLRMVALRGAGTGLQYVRVSSFVMPLAGCVPAGLATKDLDGYEIHFYVPADDHNSWRYDLGFRRSRAVKDEEVHRRKQIGPGYRRIRNAQNYYLQDRKVQNTESFTGIEDYLNHDSCATESMGSLYDRSQEHLGTSDRAVIAMRRFLLRAVREVQNGKEPPHVIREPAENSFPHIDSIAEVIPADRHWSKVFVHMKQSATDRAAPAETPAPPVGA